MRIRANGKGSVYKLSGKRTKPWAVRKTIGYNEKGHPIFKFIGYYRTYDEANRVLTEYNKSPYSLEGETLKDMYIKLIDGYEITHKESTIRHFKNSWEQLAPLHDEPIAKLTRRKLQVFFDGMESSILVKKKVKTTLKAILDYSIRYDVIPPEKIVILDYIDLSSRVEVKKVNRSVFTQEEIERLWNMDDDISHLLLFLIYTGLRAGEYCNLTNDSIDVDNVIHISHSKTKAGIRLVPLSDKALKLAPLPHFNNYNSLEYYFNKWKAQNGFDHTLHDTRHTCISLLANAQVDERIIKSIVGHKGDGVTQQVYTHISIESKREALNLI